MNKLLIASFTVIALAGCSSEQDQAMVAAPAEQALVAAPAEQDAVTYDMVGKTFYNEFIPCTAGPDFNAESVDEMIAEWRTSGISGEILGAWGYAPASEENQYPNGWWELQWTSKEAADAGWQEWVASDVAQAWTSKYENVMTCDGPNRLAWDFHFPRDPSSFGEAAESGEFASAYFPCNLNEGKTMDDVNVAIAGYNAWLDQVPVADAEFYAYGIYASNSESSEVDVYWGNFHSSFERMNMANQGWAANGGEAKAMLEATMTCGKPDLHNSKVFYNPENPDFS